VASLRLVIFDCDGVLVDSEPISNAVLAEILARHGLDATLVETRALYQGLLLTDVIAKANAALGRPLPAGFIEEYERQRDDAFRRELQPIAGAASAVALIKRAGVDVCVASQGKLAKTRLTLGLTGLDRLFPPRSRFSAEAVARGKPFPDLFMHAAATMGAAPARCAVVEDTPLGVSAARAAGMRVFGLAADSDENALHEAGAEIIHSLDELPTRLHLR
jgi:HAD superfamily hydrolase (TIGR01509 family)